MMRRTPLTRRTPLRSTTPLKAGKRSRGVPADIRAAVMLRDGNCVAAGVVRGITCAGRIDPHHVLRRSQGGPDAMDNLISLCRAHHNWVHAHPEQSIALGFLKRSWQ